MLGVTSSAVRIPTAAEWSAIGVETTLAATIVAVLIAPFFVRSQRATGLIALGGVLAAFGMTFLPAVDPRVAAFGGMIVADPAATLWRQVLLLFTAGVIGIWFGATRRAVTAQETPEFLTLLLSATIGLSLMGATSNLLLILLAAELSSMPSYVLAGFRKTRRHAAEAALKYVLFGAVCTAVMVYGLSLLYGATGTLNLAHWLAGSNGSLSPIVLIGLMLLLVGLLFKLSAVPAHFWAPDVFEGAHVDIGAYLALASKGAGVVLLGRLWYAVSSHATPTVGAMAAVIGAIAVVTTTVGNLGALRQTSVKRMLAYSAIAHAGYMLSAMAVLPAGWAQVVAYLVVYAVMTLGAFAVLAGVVSATKSDDLSAFDGLASRSPMSALAMTVCLFSMVGLPPAAGFLVKWQVMAALANAGGGWWWVLASVGVNSIISLAYYAKIIRAMYLRPTRDDVAGSSGLIGGMAVGSAALLFILFALFAPLERWAAAAVFWLPPVQTP